MAVYTWIGNGSVGNLTDPANWTVNGNANGTAPSGTDDVIIPENTTLSLSYPTGNTLDLTYQSLTIQTGATITFPTYGTVIIDALGRVVS
ncbi:hypothetical protein [Acetobacter pomorum]|uniref:hypothetical protein n=1 Tax=Acetobacter pomorum TaxID=65959 RepID=UPI0013C2F8AD|nr:hypothetical protein [Acetobacter pomorum]